MMTAPRHYRPKGTWYVSFERPGKTRISETFQTASEAKAFARAKLSENPRVVAGTINPYLPKRTIASAQLLDWLDEPDDR